MKQLDWVRQRPGMYIGDTADGSGLHRMVYELVDNAIDEALAGHCDRVEVVLNAAGTVTVRDNGRGIPADIHPREGVSAAEVIMTRLHVFGKFEQPPRAVTDELSRVCVAVVNALSEALELRIWRNGKERFMGFRIGDPEAPLAIVGNADMLDGKPRRGTEITFLPDNKIFTKTEFDFAAIKHRLRGLASLHPGVTMVLADNRGIERKEVVFRS
jgi:DNA gyrase subunit B